MERVLRTELPVDGVLPLNDIICHLMEAQRNYLFRRPVYANKALLTLTWEMSDTTGLHDSNTIARLLKTEFSFETETFKIPSYDALKETKAAIQAFITNNDEGNSRSLLVFHYAGHGYDKGELALSGTVRFGSVISFTELREAMVACKADVLIILDCCNAGAGMRAQAGDRTIEIVAACDEKMTVTDALYNTFTSHFCQTANRLVKQGNVTVEGIIQSLYWEFPTDPLPVHKRLEGSGPIILNDIGDLTKSTGLSTPLYMAVWIKAAGKISSDLLSAFSDCITLLKVSSSYEAKELFRRQLDEEVTILLALPLPLYEWLESDPAFVAAGILPDSYDPTIISPSIKGSNEEQLNMRRENDASRSIRLYQLAEECWHVEKAKCRDALMELTRILERGYGEESFILLSVLPKLAIRFEEDGNYFEATRVRIRALNIVKERYGKGHIKTVIYLYLTARAQENGGFKAAAIENYREIITICHGRGYRKLSLLSIRDIERHLNSLLNSGNII